jgi:hypothetical protein
MLIMLGRASMKPNRPRHAAPRRAGQALDQQHQLRGRGHGVAPVRHRRATRVVLAAPDRHPVAARRGDGGHDAKRQTRPIQGDGLLDVELEVPEDVPGRPPGCVEIRPAAAHRVDRRGEASPLAVAEPGRSGGVKLPAHGTATDGREPEVGRLLAGEVDHLERMRESVATRVETARDLEPRQHARDPVEASPRLHRVEVRADHEGRPRACPRPPPDLVPGGVDRGMEAGLAIRPVSHRRADQPRRRR